MQDSNISIHDLVSDSDPEELFELLDLLGNLILSFRHFTVALFKPNKFRFES